MAAGGAHVYRWSSRRDSPGLTSSMMALVVTAALFASALGAMIGVHSLPSLFTNAPVDRTTVVWLPPAVAPPPRIAPPRTRQAPPEPRTIAPVTPAVPLVAPATAPTTSPTVVAPSKTGVVGRTGVDSTGSGAAPIIPLGAIPLVPTQPLRAVPNPPRDTHVGVGGAPVSPAGVTTDSRMLTPGQRDSIVHAYMAGLSLNGPMSDRERADVARREYSPPIHNGQPEAAARAQTVGGGVSIPFPLFSPGPSAAQRKRDSIVAAENGLRLLRLRDRVLLKRDSSRADSLRRRDLRARHVPPAHDDVR